MQDKHTIESLLQHSQWVQALARTLVAPDDADDLAQDTMVAALRSPLGAVEERSTVRGWLAAAARNIARTRQRGTRHRRDRETTVAAERLRDTSAQERYRPEAVLGRSELQRSLIDAVLGLEEPYRQALLLRYFEGLTPAEIARETDTKATTVRTRLARAVGQVRERLDEESGGDRDRWVLALLPIARGGRLARTAAAGVTSATWLTFTVKLLLAVIPLVALLGWWVMSGPDMHGRAAAVEMQAAGSGAGSSIAERAMPDGSDGEGVSAQSRSMLSAVGQASQNTAQPTVRELGPLLRIIDSQGLPVTGARGAWVGRELDVIALDFDESGCAERPTPAPGHAFVFADGYLGRGVRIGQAAEGDADSVITLRPWYVLRGVVRIDGDPPGEPFLFRRLVSCEQYGGEVELAGIWPRLVALGVSPYSLDVPVDPEGLFEVTVEWELDILPLRCRNDHRVRSVNGVPPRFGDRWAAADAGATAILIELARLPAIIGRLIWDDGEPVAGEHLNLVTRSDNEQRPSRQEATTGRDGAFAFAADGTSATLLPQGRRLSNVLPLELNLAGAVYPLDLGDIDLRRPPRLEIEVVGRRAGVERPVVARVTTGLANGWTDETGRVTLEFDPEREVEILAAGYRSHRTSPSPDGAPLRVVLEPGADLTVTVDREFTDFRLIGRLCIRLTFDRSPFDSAIDAGSPGARSFSSGLYTGFNPGRSVGWEVDMSDAAAAGAILFGPSGQDPLVVPGLLPGAIVRVELVDPLGAVLASQRVVIAPGSNSVSFDAARIESTTLTIEPHWADGTPIKEGRIRVRGRGVGGRSFYFHLDSDRLVLGPIKPCVVDITTEVPGARNIEIRDVHVGANDLPIDIAVRRD